MYYELVYIVSSLVPETEHAKIQEEVLAYLGRTKAKIVTAPYSLGRKRLAYAIDGQKHGFYVAVEFELEEGSGLQDLDTDLKHNKNLLRHLVIKKSTVGKAAEETIEKKAVKPVKVVVPEEKPASLDSAKQTEEKKEDKPEVKVDLKDLDSQLDQILEKDQ